MTIERMNLYFNLIKASYSDRNCVIIVTYTDFKTVVILRTKGKSYSMFQQGLDSSTLERCFEDHLAIQNGTSCSEQII